MIETNVDVARQLTAGENRSHTGRNEQLSDSYGSSAADSKGQKLQINMMQAVSLLAGVLRRSEGRAQNKVERSALFNEEFKGREQKA